MYNQEFEDLERLWCDNCQQLVEPGYDCETYSYDCPNCHHEFEELEPPVFEDKDALFERLDELAAIDLSDRELDWLGRTRCS